MSMRKAEQRNVRDGSYAASAVPDPIILNASHTRRATMVNANAYADAGADLLLLLMLMPMPMLMHLFML